MIILRVKAGEDSINCEATGSCDCLDFFSLAYVIHVALLFCYVARIAWVGALTGGNTLTRRALKLKARCNNIFFGILFQVSLGLLAYGLIKAHVREECEDDPRFESMNAISLVIMIFTALTDIYVLTLMIMAIRRMCLAETKRK